VSVFVAGGRDGGVKSGASCWRTCTGCWERRAGGYGRGEAVVGGEL